MLHVIYRAETLELERQRRQPHDEGRCTDEKLRAMRLGYRRADEHFAVEPGRCSETGSAERNLAGTQNRRRKTQFLDVIKPHALITKAYAEPAVEYAEPVQLQGHEAEKYTAEMLQPLDLNKGFDLDMDVFVAKLGELSFLLKCISTGILPARSSQGCQQTRGSQLEARAPFSRGRS